MVLCAQVYGMAGRLCVFSSRVSFLFGGQEEAAKKSGFHLSFRNVAVALVDLETCFEKGKLQV
jgi:hypothetical protein